MSSKFRSVATFVIVTVKRCRWCFVGTFMNHLDIEYIFTGPRFTLISAVKLVVKFSFPEALVFVYILQKSPNISYFSKICFTVYNFRTRSKFQ
jgi:hypothetical protein